MRALVLVTALTFVALAAGAQNTNVPYQPFGRIVSTEIRPPDFRQMLVGRLAVAPEGPFAFGVISGKESEPSDSAGFSFGYGTKVAAHDILFIGSYSRVRPQVGDDHDRAIGYVELALADTPLASFSGSVAAVYDPDSFKAYNPVLAAEHTFIPKTLKGTVNLGWTEFSPNGGKSISDIQPAVGVSWSPDSKHLWSMGADYTLKNDVDGEDTGSISIAKTIVSHSLKIKLGVEKHRVVSLSLTRFF